MSPDAATDAIETALNAAWTTTPIAWPNLKFTPPATGQWLKVDFLWGNGQMWTKDGVASVTGILQLSIFGPKDIGDGTIDASAETARAIFNQVHMASPNQDVIFGAVSGPVKRFEESWRSVVLSAPFQVLEVVP